MTKHNLFFELVQIATGNLQSFKEIPSEKEWENLFVLAKEQSLIGVLSEAIQILPKEQRPPQNILLEWIGLRLQISETNKVLNQYTRDIVKLFAENGFDTCILKGQGSALYYPNPELRESGDIDIWMEMDRKDIIMFLAKMFCIEKQGWHHTSFEYNSVEVEIHHHPSKLYNPFDNKALQRYYSSQWPIQSHNMSILGYNIPTVEFAFIHCILHIYSHILGEGIGLRQIMDLYYIGKALPESSNNIVHQYIEKFRLQRLMGMLMYIFHEVFGYDGDLYPVNEKDGKYLLQTVMKGGNFGKFDKIIIQL